jgi:anti-sigma B factor antagonist
VEETSIEGVEVLVMRGEFDAYSTPMLGSRLDTAMAEGGYQLVVDMCEVTFVDVSTLNRLVRAIQEIYRHNGRLVVACEQRQVLRAVDLAGLRHAIRLFDSRADAIEALRSER